MFSASDKQFLKAIGVKEEDAAPAADFGVYETCPNCAARRVVSYKTGEVFCISCKARNQRDHLARAKEAMLQLANDLRAAQEHSRLYAKSLEATYRGFQIAHFDGFGWAYRGAEFPYQQWRRAASFLDAQLQIDRLQPPTIREQWEDRPVENQCRNCGEPCGARNWCRSCAIDKFGR